MALETCPECGKSVSSTAHFCPHCGYKPPTSKQRDKRNSVLVWGFSLLVLFLFILFSIRFPISSWFDRKRVISTEYTDFLEELKTNPPTQATGTDKESLAYNITYDSWHVSKFEVVETEDLSIKVLEKRMSEYTSDELSRLPINTKFSYSIVVPRDISKEGLENTLKHIVSQKIEENNDIDEIIIFAYDRKNDIGNTPYTFGKLVWAPYGELGNVTPEIAKNNIRSNYDFDIDIKSKVGNISKNDIPTERELAVYDMAMDSKNAHLSNEALDKLLMKEFGFKTKKELDSVYLKVLKYKFK